ncbi:hypothetical protein [Gordonia sp. NPDC003429]
MGASPGQAEPISVTVRSRPFTCLACGEGTKFWVREMTLERRRDAYPDSHIWEATSRSATCDTCGYVHIFRTKTA